MLHAAIAFLPFAAMLAVLPGPATAMVIQSAARGGRAHAMMQAATGALMIGFGLKVLADQR